MSKNKKDKPIPIKYNQKIEDLFFQAKIFLIPTDTCYGMACSVFDMKSYHKIYEIKKRSFKKPLSILVPDFKWLEYNTTLNINQIDFLKKTKTPFTILTNIKGRKKLLPENYKMLKIIGIRVATNKIEKEILKKKGLLFLTSANISGESEVFEQEKLKNVFGDFIKNGTIEFLKSEESLSKSGNYRKSSDIYGFIGKTTELKYLRKN